MDENLRGAKLFEVLSGAGVMNWPLRCCRSSDNCCAAVLPPRPHDASCSSVCPSRTGS